MDIQSAIVTNVENDVWSCKLEKNVYDVKDIFCSLHGREKFLVIDTMTTLVFRFILVEWVRFRLQGLQFPQVIPFYKPNSDTEMDAENIFSISLKEYKHCFLEVNWEEVFSYPSTIDQRDVFWKYASQFLDKVYIFLSIGIQKQGFTQFILEYKESLENTPLSRASDVKSLRKRLANLHPDRFMFDHDTWISQYGKEYSELKQQLAVAREIQIECNTSDVTEVSNIFKTSLCDMFEKSIDKKGLGEFEIHKPKKQDTSLYELFESTLRVGLYESIKWSQYSRDQKLVMLSKEWEESFIRYFIKEYIDHLEQYINYLKECIEISRDNQEYSLSQDELLDLERVSDKMDFIQGLSELEKKHYFKSDEVLSKMLSYDDRNLLYGIELILSPLYTYSDTSLGFDVDKPINFYEIFLKSQFSI